MTDHRSPTSTHLRAPLSLALAGHPKTSEQSPRTANKNLSGIVSVVSTLRIVKVNRLMLLIAVKLSSLEWLIRKM